MIYEVDELFYLDIAKFSSLFSLILANLLDGKLSELSTMALLESEDPSSRTAYTI